MTIGTIIRTGAKYLRAYTTGDITTDIISWIFSIGLVGSIFWYG